MKRFRWCNLAVVLACNVIAVAVHGIEQIHAQEKANITNVLKTALSVTTAQEVNILQFDVPPGWSSPRHYHSGEIFLYVMEGTGNIETDGQTRTARSDEVVHLHAEQIMVMRNASASVPLKFILFQVGAIEAPLIIEAE